MFETAAQIKEKIDAIVALQKEYSALFEEMHSSYDAQRVGFIQLEELPRVTNALYDASLDFQEAFHAAFGLYPRELGDATASRGYRISKKYPTKHQLEWEKE